MPDANVRFDMLDLASLQSVKDFGIRLRRQRTSLDLLINNAAVMAPPTRQVTSDGFEHLVRNELSRSLRVDGGAPSTFA